MTAPRIHKRIFCDGYPCPFHAPSAHHMSEWPTNIRMDKAALTERLCPHGVGHPDPDSLAYFRRRLRGSFDRYGLDVHGCDGCCAPRTREPVPDVFQRAFEAER